MKPLSEMEAAVKGMSGVIDGRADEYDDILRLLMDHATRAGEETEKVARYVASCSLKENHLWQDMGLNNRGELSDIMRTYFGPLAAKNTADMKWKKFFYKRICEREGFMLCKSPSCGVCVDYGKCFGPEV